MIDVLIVGQGICGTCLSLELEQAGLSQVVIDQERPDTASRAAAGLINPVTGRRMVKTWMIDELLPFVREKYAEIDAMLRSEPSGEPSRKGAGLQSGKSFIQPASVIDFFPTPQMRIAFLDRHAEEAVRATATYLQLPVNEHYWDDSFRYDFGYGRIGSCYLVDMSRLLATARSRMRQRGILREEAFAIGEMEVAGERSEGTDGNDRIPALGIGGRVDGGQVQYRDIEARYVVFCDGVGSAVNPYFSRLPFAPNKGEALIVEIPELKERMGRMAAGNRNGGGAGMGMTIGGPGMEAGGSLGEALIFKKGISLVPWQEGLFWAGSSYEWSFTNDQPTEAFRKRTEAALSEWLKMPFRTVHHFASVRPATLERRPFVGFHPLYPAVGMLNGMGTKGCSLAPFFARQLRENVVNGTPIQPEADLRRFSKILSRG